MISPESGAALACATGPITSERERVSLSTGSHSLPKPGCFKVDGLWSLPTCEAQRWPVDGGAGVGHRPLLTAAPALGRG